MSTSTIFQVLRFEDEGKRILVVKREYHEDEGKRIVVVKREYHAVQNNRNGRTEVFIEGSADLSQLGVDEPIAYSVPLAVPNQDNLTILALVTEAFKRYDDRAQKAVNDLFAEYKTFKEQLETKLRLEATQNAATKILGVP